MISFGGFLAECLPCSFSIQMSLVGPKSWRIIVEMIKGYTVKESQLPAPELQAFSLTVPAKPCEQSGSWTEEIQSPPLLKPVERAVSIITEEE